MDSVLHLSNNFLACEIHPCLQTKLQDQKILIGKNHILDPCVLSFVSQLQQFAFQMLGVKKVFYRHTLCYKINQTTQIDLIHGTPFNTKLFYSRFK